MTHMTFTDRLWLEFIANWDIVFGVALMAFLAYAWRTK